MGVLRYCYSDGGTDMKKGKVEFHSRGQSGNIYYIIGAVREVMKKQSRLLEYNDMWDEVQNAKSYQEALKIIAEHVELVDLDGLYRV